MKFKKRKITTVKRFRYPVFVSITISVQIVFYWLSKHLQCRQKYSPLRFVFSPLFSVFGYPYETLSLVSDILLQNKVTTFVFLVMCLRTRGVTLQRVQYRWKSRDAIKPAHAQRRVTYSYDLSHLLKRYTVIK